MATPAQDDQAWRREAESHGDLAHLKRLEYVFKSGIWSDVTFRVGKAFKVKAHKLILSIGSKVLEDLFKVDAVKNSFDVPDLEPMEFKLLIEYLYTGKCNVNESNRVQILKAAHKYEVKELVRRCTQLLGNTLTPKSAIEVLQQAIIYDDKDLEEKALRCICTNGKTIIQSSEFLLLSAVELGKILERDDLEVEDELNLFLAVIEWGKAECKRQGSGEMTPKYMRSALESVIHLIRFPLMDPSDFSVKVASTSILLTEEIVTVLLHFNVKPELKDAVSSGSFNSKPRKAATASSDGTQKNVLISCFAPETETDWLIRSFLFDEPQHRDAVSSGSFNSKPRKAATASSDGTQKN